MSRALPLTTGEALDRLLTEYKATAGRAPDMAVTTICAISADRAMKEDFQWIKTDNPNFPIQLVWMPAT